MPTAPMTPKTPRMLANRVPLFPPFEVQSTNYSEKVGSISPAINQKSRLPALVLSSPINWQPPSISAHQCVASSPIEPQKEDAVVSPCSIQYEHAEREAISILMSMTKTFPKKMRLLNDFKGEDGNHIKTKASRKEQMNLKGQLFSDFIDEGAQIGNKSKANRRIVLTRKMQQSTPLPPFKAFLHRINRDRP